MSLPRQTPARLLARLRWEARRAWERLDATGLLALAAVALWLGIHVTVNVPLAAEAQRLAQQADQQRNAALEPPVRGSAAAARSSTELVAFFPDREQREKDLRHLHQLAAKQGLGLIRADYRSEPLAALPLQRFALRLQLRGDYARQRLFLQALLRGFPHLAVERLSLEGASGAPEAMTALLEAHLYYRAAPAPGKRT